MLAMTEASQTEHLMPWIGAFAAGFAFIAIGGRWVFMRLGQPLLEIVARWSRLFAISLSATYLAFIMDWSIAENRPPWSLAAFLFLSCILFVTVHTWFKVRGFSYEDTPLFPNYFRNEEPDEWPTNSNHIRLREWIREEGFRQVGSLRAHPSPEFCIREFHFDSEDGLTRFSVNFIPRGHDGLCVSHAASSVAHDGVRYITDNAFVPFGGYFPDNWILDRKPFTQSAAKLLERHRKRMKTSGKEFSPWMDLPANDIKEQHRLLEKANRDHGILNPRTKWAKFGRFSQEGCYRIWKEILLLNYFGIIAW